METHEQGTKRKRVRKGEDAEDVKGEESEIVESEKGRERQEREKSCYLPHRW